MLTALRQRRFAGLRPPDERTPQQPGDRVFSRAAGGSAVFILAILGGVATFLLIEGWPAVTAPAEQVDGDGGLARYLAPLVFGTLVSSVIALVLAVPLAVGIALFISHYAPRRLAAALGYVVDLLAAIPSVIYGLWGITVLAPASVPVAEWLAAHLGFLPLFGGPASATGRTMLVAGVVLAVMVLPIITAVTREVFLQTPALQQEASLALGATRWEMIRMTVFPFGQSGVVSASMLGLGRALGETMAVTLVLSASGGITLDLIGASNPPTIAANIALDFQYATGIDVNVLIASGLVLFVITLAVNMAARAIVNRRRGSGGTS